MPPEIILGGVIVVALILYALGGGADFGGGVWDLLATGPRRTEQRKLIENAIGPIWEANHVWLILVAVLVFSAFPPVFAEVSIDLHVPLTIFLIGVVFRGAAFTFRSYELRRDQAQRRWGWMFSMASLASPFWLGVMVGTIASGNIQEPGAWQAPFPFATGAFAIVLFSFLAATYLAEEAETPELKSDFRTRALITGLLVAVLAMAVFLLSEEGAPRVREGLTSRPWTWPLHLGTAVCATSALALLWYRRFAWARYAAAAQVALIVLGWAVSQYPCLVEPHLTLFNSAANPRTLKLLLGALVVGFVLLAPSLLLLYRVFKTAEPKDFSA